MTQSELPPVLQGVLESAEKLPPFPNIVRKVMPLIRNMAPVSEIEAVIMYDQAITARVLALSRAPIYARHRKIGSLRDAIVALGEQQLIMVILTACVSRYFADENEGYDLREGELCEHAIGVALMAELVGRRIGWKNLLTIYTAALMHDIGKTVLNFYVKSYYESIYVLVKKNGLSFIDAERQVLGIDHQELGSMITRSWHFPEQVVAAINYHHQPTRAKEHQDLASIIYVADRMVTAMGIGCGLDGLNQPNEDKVFEGLGLNGRIIDNLLAELLETFEETKHFLAAA